MFWCMCPSVTCHHNQDNVHFRHPWGFLVPLSNTCFLLLPVPHPQATTDLLSVMRGQFAFSEMCINRIVPQSFFFLLFSLNIIILRFIHAVGCVLIIHSVLWPRDTCRVGTLGSFMPSLSVQAHIFLLHVLGFACVIRDHGRDGYWGVHVCAHTRAPNPLNKKGGSSLFFCLSPFILLTDEQLDSQMSE